MLNQELSNLIFYKNYSKLLPNGKKESFTQMIDRISNMHNTHLQTDFPEAWNNKDFQALFEKTKRMMSQGLVFGSQRANQFGGNPILAKNMRLYNCFSKNTEFITRYGVKSFVDFKHNDETIVLTHLGNWKKAVVKNYGVGRLNKINFRKSSSENFSILATKDHRWILANGDSTENLQVGQSLFRQPSFFNDFEYEKSNPMERLYWAYGLVYGDGTKVKDEFGVHRYSMIRLCGHDKKYQDRFEELGFNTNTAISLNGDFMAYTGTYLKTLPNPEIDSLNLIRAFIRGFLDADGAKNNNFSRSNNASMFLSIQQTSKEAQAFIRKMFPSVGVYLVSEREVKKETNFGIHDAVSFRISTNMAGSSPIWKVHEIEEDYTEGELWCLEVEDDHSFVFPNGIVTGNCSSTYIDRPRVFAEIMHTLLCGAGVGISVQKAHVDKLPLVQRPKDTVNLYSIEDSIEG